MKKAFDCLSHIKLSFLGSFPLHSKPVPINIYYNIIYNTFFCSDSSILMSLSPLLAPRNSRTNELQASLGVLDICWSTSSMYCRRSLITDSLIMKALFGGEENTTLGNFCVNLLHNSSNTSYFCGIYDNK